MRNKDKRRDNRELKLRARLGIDEGFAEKPLHSIKAYTTEKPKGLLMIELIENYFNISEEDRKNSFKQKLKEINENAFTPTEFPKDIRDKQVKITRDEKGNIVSPFASKKKLI